MIGVYMCYASKLKPRSSKRYTEQEVRDFYRDMYTNKEKGCYSVHVPTWARMVKEHPNLCCEIESDYRVKGLLKDFPPVKPKRPENEPYKAREDNNFPWYPFLCGWCCGTLFWTLIYVVFGG